MPSWRDFDSNVDDYDLMTLNANIRSGDNSADDDSDWELMLGALAGQKVWFTGGVFNTPQVNFNLTLHPGGGENGVSFTVGDAATLTTSDASYDTIEKVAISAASYLGGIELQHVVVACFVSGVPTNSNEACVSAVLSNTGSSLTCINTTDRVLVCPSNTTKIIVTGTVHLTAGALPDINDLRGYISVWY